MQKKIVFLISLLAFILIVAAFYIGRQSSSLNVDESSALVLEQAGTAKESGDGNSSGVAHGPAEKVTLPAPYTPIKSMFPALQVAAERGDVKAACRLGIELARCKLAVSGAEQINIKLAEMEKTANKSPQMANHFAELQLKYLRYKNEVCAGVDTADLARSSKYLHQAALAGNADAVIAYVDGQAFGSDESLMFLQDEGLGAWQRDAQRIAENSVRAGTPEAVFLLQDAYINDDSFFSALVVNQPTRALMYEYLLASLTGRPLVSNPDFSRQANSEAMEQAGELHRKHFNNKTFSYPELMRRTKLLSIESDTDKPVCE